MLTVLSSLALGVLLFAVAAFVTAFVLPAGGIGDTAKQAVAVLLFLAVLSPLLPKTRPAAPEVRLPEAVAADPGDLLSGTLEVLFLDLCRPVAEKYTALPFELRVRTHTPENGGIDITVVELHFNGVFDGAQALSRELIDLLGTAVRVVTPAEEGED